MTEQQISFQPKIALFAAILALSLSFSSAARADIVRSSDGAPVLSSNGNCVISNWEGSDKCEAAKAAAGEGAALQDETKVEHEGVVYFGFNKASLTPKAKHELDHLAKKLHAMSKGRHGPSIVIAGYADRIGNADYNKKLALKRARSVRGYLLSKGVKPRRIEVRSLGESDPRTNCPNDLPRAKLIDCLQADRRVEIEISGHE